MIDTYSETIYFLPVIAVLSSFKLNEPVTMDGDLQEELIRLFSKYLSTDSFELVRNEKLSELHVSLTYPEETSLWTIFDAILARYKLRIVFLPGNKNPFSEKNKLRIQLVEGFAWKR